MSKMSMFVLVGVLTTCTIAQQDNACPMNAHFPTAGKCEMSCVPTCTKTSTGYVFRPPSDICNTVCASSCLCNDGFVKLTSTDTKKFTCIPTKKCTSPHVTLPPDTTAPLMDTSLPPLKTLPPHKTMPPISTLCPMLNAHMATDEKCEKTCVATCAMTSTGYVFTPPSMYCPGVCANTCLCNEGFVQLSSKKDPKNFTCIPMKICGPPRTTVPVMDSTKPTMISPTTTTCGENQHFANSDQCESSCTDTCDKNMYLVESPPFCFSVCATGCLCDKGFLPFDNGDVGLQCVPVADCKVNKSAVCKGENGVAVKQGSKFMKNYCPCFCDDAVDNPEGTCQSCSPVPCAADEINVATVARCCKSMCVKNTTIGLCKSQDDCCPGTFCGTGRGGGYKTCVGPHDGTEKSVSDLKKEHLTCASETESPTPAPSAPTTPGPTPLPRTMSPTTATSLRCPHNSVPDKCTSACVDTCNATMYFHPNPGHCKDMCREGCTCDPGYAKHPAPETKLGYDCVNTKLCTIPSADAPTSAPCDSPCLVNPCKGQTCNLYPSATCSQVCHSPPGQACAIEWMYKDMVVECATEPTPAPTPMPTKDTTPCDSPCFISPCIGQTCDLYPSATCSQACHSPRGESCAIEWTYKRTVVHCAAQPTPAPTPTLPSPTVSPTVAPPCTLCKRDPCVGLKCALNPNATCQKECYSCNASWTLDKMPVECSPKYNCNTKELWSEDKQEWCCENENKGCGVADSKCLACVDKGAAWQRETCSKSCMIADLPCRTTKADCVKLALETTMQEKCPTYSNCATCAGELTRLCRWSNASFTNSPGKCVMIPENTYMHPFAYIEQPKSCPLETTTPTPTTITYNCNTEELWSEDKQEWCCENENKGCSVADSKCLSCVDKGAAWQLGRCAKSCMLADVPCRTTKADCVQWALETTMKEKCLTYTDCATCAGELTRLCRWSNASFTNSPGKCVMVPQDWYLHPFAYIENPKACPLVSTTTLETTTTPITKTVSPEPKPFCKARNGTMMPKGSEWQEGPCTTCSCEKPPLPMCFQRSCPRPQACHIGFFFVTPPGVCCGSCQPGKKLKLKFGPALTKLTTDQETVFTSALVSALMQRFASDAGIVLTQSDMDVSLGDLPMVTVMFTPMSNVDDKVLAMMVEQLHSSSQPLAVKVDDAVYNIVSSSAVSDSPTTSNTLPPSPSPTNAGVTDATPNTPVTDNTVPQSPGTGPKPTGTGPKPTGTGPKPTGTGPKPTGTGPIKPTGTGPIKPTGTGPKPTGTGPKPTGTGPKPTGTDATSRTATDSPPSTSTVNTNPGNPSKNTGSKSNVKQTALVTIVVVVVVLVLLGVLVVGVLLCKRRNQGGSQRLHHSNPMYDTSMTGSFGLYEQNAPEVFSTNDAEVSC